MEFKGVSPDQVEVYIIDDKVHDEDLESGYPLSGPRGELVTSLLGSMDLLSKTRIGCWEGQGPDVVKEDIVKCNPKVIVGLGSTLMREFVDTNKKITEVSGQVFNININGQDFKYLVLMSPSYVVHKMEDPDLVLRFSQDLYKACQITLGEFRNPLENKEVLSAHSYEEFVNIYESKIKNDERLAYDIETNARPIFSEDSEIIGFSVSNETAGVYVSLSALDFEMDSDEKLKIFDYLKDEIFENHKLVIHNTQYERPYTLTCLGYEIGFDKADDTLVMARLLKNPKEGAGLKYQAQKYCQYPDWETDLTNYISGFRGVVSRIIFGPKKYSYLWGELKEGIQNIFDIEDTKSFQGLSDEDKDEIRSILSKLKSSMIDLYTASEIDSLGQMIFEKLLVIESQGGILDSTIPYNWIPDRVLSKYGAIDSIATYDLYGYFTDVMDKESTDKVDLHKGYRLWLEHMYVAYIMERNGMYWNDEMASKDREFLDNQATNCLKSMLVSPVFEPMIKESCEWKFKPLILSDYLPQVAESQGYLVEYSKETGKYIVKYNGKRVAKKQIDNIVIPPQYELQYFEILKDLFNQEINDARHYEDLKEIYNPSSPTQTYIPRRILDTPTLQMGGRVFQLHTLAESPEFSEIIDKLPYVDQKFLKVAKLLGNPKDLKKAYGGEWGFKRKELFEGFCTMYSSLASRVTTPEIRKILNNKKPVEIESFDDGGIIYIYNNLVVTGIDQDDRRTWTPEFEWMINFRLFKKSQKIISSYIDGSVGRESVCVIDKKDFDREDHLIKRKRSYDPNLKESEDYLLAAKWSPNTADTGRWRSACHCHPGWTEIKLTDGRDLPIEEVVKEFSEGKDLFVYSIDTTPKEPNNNCRPRIAKIQEAYLSHYTREFVRLTLDNGEVVDVTPDHKMIRRDSTYCYAVDLNEGDSLYPSYFVEDKKGYLKIYDEVEKDFRYCHYLADEYNERYGLLKKIPEDEFGKAGSWCRHHVNFDHRDNRPTNVIRVGWSAHRNKYHAGNKEFYKKAWEHRRERGNDPAPDFYGRLVKRATEDPEFEKRWKGSKSRNGYENMKLKWQSEEYCKSHVERNKVRGFNKAVQLISTIYDKNSDTIKLTPEIYEELRLSQGKSSMGIMKWDSLMKYVDSTNDLINQVRHYAYYNHKVLKKEYVTLDEPIPVYSLSIDQDSPNYALSAGIFIGNTVPWGSQVKKYYTSRFTGGTCLSGDTEVYLLSGERLTIKDLAERSRDGEYVLSYDIDSNSIIPVFARNFRETRKVDKLVKVSLSDGTVIKSTLDHLFYNKQTSSWVKAEDLRVGDSLLSIKFSEDKDGYVKVRGESDGVIRSSWVHRLVNRYYSPLENYEEMVTHHIDENKQNNLPDNLVWVNRREHQSYHAKKQIHREVSSSTREKLSKLASDSKKKYWENIEEDELNRLKEVWRQANLRPDSYQQSEESRKQASINITKYNKSSERRERASKVMSECWKTDSHKVKVLRGRIAHNINLIYINGEEFSEKTYNKYRVKGSPKFNQILVAFSSFEDAEEYSRNYNLMVSKVEIITADNEPVYCCTVEGTHNFILKCGLVSHNCLAPDYSQMEVRTLAAISHDENMLELFHSGKDFHSETAKKVYKKDEVTEAERRFSKTACVLGTTRVALLDGTSPMIKDILTDSCQDQWVYSYDVDTGHFVPGRMVNCRETKRVNEYAIVKFDDGTQIECTVDHKLLCRDGLYRSVQNLKPGDSVMPFNTKVTKNQNVMNGYEMYCQDGEWYYTHRMCDEVCLHDEDAEFYEVRHHVNYNKLDNRPNNILLTSKKLHLKYHHSPEFHKYTWKSHNETWRSNKVKGLTDWTPERRESQSVRMRQRCIDGFTKYRNTCKILKYIKSLLVVGKVEQYDDYRPNHLYVRFEDLETYFGTSLDDIIQSAWKYPGETFKIKKLDTSDLSERGRKQMNNLWSNEDFVERKSVSQSNLMTSQNSSKEFQDNARYGRVLKIVRKAWIFNNQKDFKYSEMKSILFDHGIKNLGIGEKDFIKFFGHDFKDNWGQILNEAKSYNHEVVSVTIVHSDEPIPVYAPSVEKYENFCIVTSVDGDLCKSGVVSGQTFSLLYGAMEESFARNYCNGDLDYASMVYGGFYEAYPDVQRWIQERHKEVQRDHRVSLELSGRFIQIVPDGEGKGALNSMLRKSQNFPIQGQSADLTGGVIFDIQKYIEENHMKSLIIQYVHDSIEVDVYPYELIQLVDKLRVLLNESPMRRMGLPSKAEVTLGKSLGHEIEMESIDYNEDFTEGTLELKGYQDEIYETVENWKKAYKVVEILEEEYEDKFVSLGELFILRKAYTPTLGTLRHKGKCKVHIKYY